MKRKTTHTPKSRPRVPRGSVSARELYALIRTNALFTHVPQKRVLSLLPKLTCHRYARGQRVFDESTRGKDLYLIASGRIRITKATREGIESRLAVLHERDFFGELSVLDGAPRSARAEAMEESVIVTLKASDFRDLMEESRVFSSNLLQNLARRLRTMDHSFVLELERNTHSLKIQTDKLHMLVEASKIVNSSIELDRLLELILDFASRTIKADRGTIYLIDPVTSELWSKVVQGNNMVEIRLPQGKGLAGYVARTGETINIADAYKDPRFNPEIDKKSGYRTHNVLCMPMRNKQGDIVGVFQFLNKRGGPFAAEDEAFIEGFSIHAAIAVENARMAQQMVNNERLTAVGRMAGTIIHDIKSPMNTLRLYAQVIKTKVGNEEAIRMADQIIRQVDRFVQMAQDILDFSRGISETQITSVQLGEVMHDVLNFLELDLARKNVTLTRDIRYGGPIAMDVEKMVRVFHNLATNAADAMPKGGSLCVETSLADGMVQIRFIDTGTGMSEEVRGRIFEPFFTYGKKHGTGLGLAIVKKIIEDHEGAIEVMSEAGKGTTFTIRLTAPQTGA